MDGSLRVPYLTEDAESADALATRLAAASDRIVVEAESRPDAWLARVDDADCLLVDDDVASEDDYAVFGRLRDVAPDVPVLLTIPSGSETHPGDALDSGASDYVYLADGEAAYDALATRIENAATAYRDASGSVPTADHVDPWQAGNANERPGGERKRELERYETLLELMPDTVVVSDLDGNLVDVHGYEGWSGYTEDDLVEDHMGFALTPESVERAEEVVADIILSDDKESATFDVEIETADGRVIPFEDHITVLPPDENGEIPGTMSVLRNIEERKQRERELQRYASIVDATGDAVYALDADGYFTFSNEAHQEIVDRPESEILGAHASSALPDEAVEDGRAHIRELLESGERGGTYEMEVQRPDGERIPTENHVVLLTDEDGEFRGTVGVLRDISERQERERELQRQNERLERFASIASHDLRNPLNLAQGHLELLEADGEHAETIGKALDRMEQLIEDTLTWARQGASVDEREPISLADLALACWESVGSDAGTIEVVDDVTVLGDLGRVRQIVENLLRNAVEHGSTSPRSSSTHEDAVEHGGEDVTVRIGRLADGNGFYVEDDGPGIPPEDRESVFDAGVTTAADGTGFGLAIVAEIVEAHGWDIAVTESADGGARFEITGVDHGV